MNRFSANLGFLWSDLGLLDRIRAAADAGFEAVELHWPYDTPPQDILRCCRDAGVRLLAMNSPRGDLSEGENGLAALAGREAEFREGLLRAAEFAVAAGAPRMHVMAGVTPNTAAARATLAENLCWAEEAVPELGFLLEPLNNFDAPGYLYHLPGQAVRVIEEAGLRRTQLMFDIYHVGREGLSPAKEFDRFRDHVGHVQIAAVPNRTEPHAGSVDMAVALKHLLGRGYSGWIGCEYKPERTVEAGLPRLRQLASCLDADPERATSGA
ncbi:hydroxypyruvate isomerase family protein [Poseidonocella sp. HB161398]|uniref:hydroxypyruvate isomerase family protein n=1 Tax=Poseidonocella sp. HB161398 TaxID=2320855 RepID=UPI00110A05CD|nr:TIM barrel protein [Poseidonocella sp. HB161398]